MVPVPAKHMQVVLNAGFLLVAAGKFAAANLQFENALKIDPWSVLAANNRALCLLYSGHLRDAISALEAILGTLLFVGFFFGFFFLFMVFGCFARLVVVLFLFL